MTLKSTAAKSAGQPQGAPSEGVRTVVSLLLFIHLFCVFVALCANYEPSGLQVRFLRVVRAYTQLLNFDLNQTPYQLTHAEAIDVDHRIEVLPADSDENDPTAWRRIVSGHPAGERYKRYERLGEIVDVSTELGIDRRVATLASSVGAYSLAQEKIRPKQIRFRRHSLVSLEAYSPQGTPEDRDPHSPRYFSVIYAANAVVDESTGTVEVVKIESASDVARPGATP